MYNLAIPLILLAMYSSMDAKSFSGRMNTNGVDASINLKDNSTARGKNQSFEIKYSYNSKLNKQAKEVEFALK